jgi:hypothetical protein
LSKHSKTSLGWNQTAYNFLCDILGGGSKQVLQLDGAELLNDSALLADALMEALFKLIELAFFFVQVLYQPPSTFLHFVKSSFKALNNSSHRTLNLSAVLRMPDVVGDKLFDSLLPLVLEHVFFSHDFKLIHESVHILDQDIISSYQDLLLLGLILLLRMLLFFQGALGWNLRSLTLGLSLCALTSTTGSWSV